MRRIDKMTAEQVADLFARTEKGDCEKCPAQEMICTGNCNQQLREYLMQDVPMKKRFQTYDSMERAYPDFKSFCNENRCDTCRMPVFSRLNLSCFAFWLDEEVEDDADLQNALLADNHSDSTVGSATDNCGQAIDWSEENETIQKV